MLDTEKSSADPGIIDVIRALAANRESGMLQTKTGTTEGVFFFRNGQLVDARMGGLTGFQALNAAASMRGASFSFDPSVATPSVSTIRPNERILLKQFFGIDTVAPEEAHDTVGLTWSEDNSAPSRVVPLSAEAASTSDDANEVTLETTGIPRSKLRNRFPYTLSSRLLYRSALIVALLFILIAAAAVALRNKFRERALQPTVATTVSSPSLPVAEKVGPKNPATSSEAPDLSGKWNVVNTVQKTAYRSFENLKIGFNLSINQTGKSFTGKGEKVSENGRSLPAGSRTPIQVKGSIVGDRVEATFFEEGTLRKTNGRFVWRIDKASGGLTGTFVSTAAGSSGKSAARKEL